MAPFKIKKSWEIAKKILHLLFLYVNVNVGRQLYIDSYTLIAMKSIHYNEWKCSFFYKKVISKY